MLRLSRHCLPQVQHGRRAMIPSNMAPGADRTAFLEGLLENGNLYLREGLPADVIRGWLERVPLARDLAEVTVGPDGARVVAKPGARARIAFDPGALGIALLDALSQIW